MTADLLKKWAPPPLLCEYRGDGVLSIRDGSHRFEALKQVGQKKYWVIVWCNTLEDYYTFHNQMGLTKITELFKETNETQRLLALRSSRNHRYRYREFILEGRAALDQAYEAGWKVKSLFYPRKQELSTWAKYYLAKRHFEAAYALPDTLMGRVADKVDGAEMIGIAETNIRPFDSYTPSPRDVVVVLDEPQSPGNLGMMIRSARAFGARALVISGNSADEYDPKCIRASVGTFFSLPIYRVEGIRKFAQKIETLRDHHSIRIVASGNKGDTPLDNVSWEGDPLFLILGNEATGVSEGYRQIAHQFVHLPLTGKFTSLNVAAAGSIFLHEIFKQRTKTT
jgi:TrmH family RNA methyltransferase